MPHRPLALFVWAKQRVHGEGSQLCRLLLHVWADQRASQAHLFARGRAAGDRCLEIGTGRGYQAAVLAELCLETYSIEYLPEVATFGRRNLEALGYLERSVFLRVGDGYAGWPDRAPFDAIIVTAAPERVPPPLLEQLAMGGRLVIPVGSDLHQTLEVWTRIAVGETLTSFSRREVFGVQFVPFLGPHRE